MFRFFQSLAPITDPPMRDGAPLTPPRNLLGFYWFYARQTKWLYAALLVTGAFTAWFDALVPIFIGRVASMASAPDAAGAFDRAWTELVWLGAAILIGTPTVLAADSLLRHVALTPGVQQMIRWQNHWHVIRQSWPFFQNDFAGRIATRVMNTAGALRDTILSAIRAVWYLVVYAGTAVALLATLDPVLCVPVILWFATYLAMLAFFVPRMRDRAKMASLARSTTTGRIVDAYTNVLTVKLFARASDEDAYARRAFDQNLTATQASMRMTTFFTVALNVMNTSLLALTAVLSIYLWRRGIIAGSVIAVTLPLVWRISSMAGWVAWEIAGIFENIGTVQEGMLTIAVPHTLLDKPDAPELVVTRGVIEYDHVHFGYGRTSTVLDGFNLRIDAGEKIGLVGRSGAGKSTLVNLLLRFHDVEGGAIRVDGQDVRDVTQESLRGAIGMVTQDTSLLHRSIRENIRYGRRDATDAEVELAARRAHAHDFILGLEDWEGRRGYDARVGERGVKLSGGQRQRVATARVILKNAPILVLDEATSALDSEVEAAIQENFVELMGGKTVIAIAHRLSTIARMDRLVVVDQGRIIEQGSHDALLRRGGVYSSLWARQSGGFIGETAMEEAAE